MGGRGASSGMSNSGKPYGTEYHSVLEVDNIKFVVYNDSTAAKSPQETMTKGRIYVTLDQENSPKYITFYDNENKRYKQIDLKGQPHMINGEKKLPHTHFGYEHDENGTYDISADEAKLIDKIKKIWYNHLGR